MQVYSFRIIRAFLIIILVWVAIQVLFTGQRVSKRLSLDSKLNPCARPQNSQSKVESKIIDNQVIVDADLFGIKSKSTTKKLPLSFIPTLGHIAALSDHLNIVGTIAGPPSIARVAVHNKRNKLTKRYRIGERIEGALLQEIHKNHVVLEMKGEHLILRRTDGLPDPSPVKQQKLTLDPYKIEKNPLPSSQSKHQIISEDLLTETKLTPHLEMKGEVSILAKTKELSNPPNERASHAPGQQKTSTIDPYKIEEVPLASSDSEDQTVIVDLLTKTNITPHRVNDENVGLKITGLEKVPLAQDLGLRDGDIVNVINGQEVKTLQKAYQVLRKSKGQNQLTIELTRDNQRETLSF